MTIKRKRKKTNLLVCESHQIIDASHELSLIEIRLIQLCLAKMYQVDKVVATKAYDVPLHDYAEVFGLSNNAAYKVLKEAADTLVTKVIKFKANLVDSTASPTAIRVIHWVNKVQYDPADATIKIWWAEDLLHLLGDYTQENKDDINKELLYSKYYLDNTCQMTSIHSIRLYRLLNKWVKVGKLERTLEEFKRLIGIESTSYTEFDNLKRKIIDKSVQDINELSNLNITVDYKRAGRKVTGVIFNIQVKDGAIAEGSYE